MIHLIKDSKWYSEEPRQTAVISVELVGNLLVFLFSTVSVLVIPHMK